MTKLKAAILGTIWITAVLVAYLWFGIEVLSDLPYGTPLGYWCFGCIAAGGLAASPFVIYSSFGNEYEGEHGL